jgi:hypothetical protein
MVKTNIVVEFKSGAFLIVDNPADIQIFISRHDITDVIEIIYRGRRVNGAEVSAIKGVAAKSRIRYV